MRSLYRNLRSRFSLAGKEPVCNQETLQGEQEVDRLQRIEVSHLGHFSSLCSASVLHVKVSVRAEYFGRNFLFD